MNRKQISILQAVGKDIKSIAISASGEEMMFAIGDSEFAILRAKPNYGGDAEIQHEVSYTEFCRYGYLREELEKVFDADTMAKFDARDADQERLYRARKEAADRKTFEELKAKFEKNDRA